MSITSADLEFRYASPAASAGNQLAQRDPAASLGGYLSQTVWAGGSPEDLFQDISGTDNANLLVDYRCVFLLNKHASLTWTGVVAWLNSQEDGGAQVAIGVDPRAASALASDSQQAAITDTPQEAPVGVSFSSPTEFGQGIALGDLLPGHGRALWIRRSAFATPALSGDSFSLSVQGDTL